MAAWRWWSSKGIRKASSGPALLVALAAIALRLWHIRHGLPDFVEEAIPFKKAFEMWGWDTGAADLNPHLFHYPALSFYLHFLIQKLHFGIGHLLGWFGGPGDYFVKYALDPTPMVLAARWVGVLADGATVLGIAVIGERIRRGAGLVAAALVAFSPAMILDARSIFSDTQMAALAVWALERMLEYRRGGRRSVLIAAIALIGLAAGAKYPAGLLVLPLAWVLAERHGRRAFVLWPAAAAASLIVFLITSPFTVLDFRAFWADVSQLAGFARGGHLGNLERPAFGYYALDLARQLGWVGMTLLVLSLVMVIADARRRGTVIVLWLFLLAFGIPISLGRLEAERYLVPIIPAAAVLASMAAFDLIGRSRARLRPWLGAALVLGLILPVGDAGWAAAASGADSTQLAARRWLEAHLEPQELLIEEAYGARLATAAILRRISRRQAFATANPALQRRFLAQRTYHVVSLPLVTLGHATVVGRLPNGAPTTIELFPHMVESNQVFYEPGLCAGADYILTSSTVRGRYESDPRRFPVENRLYRLLDEHATKVAEFRSSAATEGPAIAIYRLTDRTRSAWLEPTGTLDPLWWTAAIPAEARRWIVDQATPPGGAISEAPRTASGEVAPWVASLRTMYEELIRDFNAELSLELIEAGRYGEAQRLAEATLTMVPDDLQACRVFLLCANKQRDWRGALEVVERVLRDRDPGGDRLPDLQLEYAVLLARAGEIGRAREQLARVLAAAPPGSSIARDAEAIRRALGAAAGRPR